jgi:hypothetical protein
VDEEPAVSAPCFTRLTRSKSKNNILSARNAARRPTSDWSEAGFQSDRVAGFNLECTAGFIAIRNYDTISYELLGSPFNSSIFIA